MVDLTKSGRYMYIDIFYVKTCATTKISTVAGYHVVLATFFFCFFESNDMLILIGCCDK